MERDMNAMVKEVEKEFPSRPMNLNVPRNLKGYWAEGEEDDEDTQAEDMDEWHDDDISSYAHGDLEQHREAREYARLAAWELPLLSSTSVSLLPLPIPPNPSLHLSFPLQSNLTRISQFQN
jgi:small subunit ribosomal protein S35